MMAVPSIGGRKRELTTLFSREGIPNPHGNAEILLCAALGYSRAALLLHASDSMPREAEERLAPLLKKRMRRIPLEYVLGEAFFYGRSFTVGPGCLIPRPETELLVEEALSYLPKEGRVVDWGTGSGCIAATLALERPSAEILGVDASPLALCWAWKNLRLHGLLGRVFLWHVETPRRLPWKEGVNLIVSNPPYIPRKMLPGLMEEVRREPEIALSGGEDGLEAYRLLLPWAEEVLVPKGILAVEIGDASQVSPLFEMNTGNLVPLGVRKDYNGLERILLWEKSA